MKIKEKLGYANGNFGKQLLFGTLEFTLLFYLTDILGVNPLLSGIIIFLSLVLDALLDPVIGAWIERHKVRYGTYIFIGSIAYSLSFIALFSLAILGWNWVPVLCLVLAVIRASYTLIDVPHNAFISKLFADGDERTQVSAYRFFFSCIASMTVALAVTPILSGDTTQDEARNFFHFALIAGFLSFLSLSLVSKVAINHEVIPSRERNSQGFKEYFSNLLILLRENKPFQLLLGVFFLTGACSPALAKGMTYFAKYYLSEESLSGLFLASIIAGQMLSLPLWVKMSARFEKKVALKSGHALLFLSSGLFFILAENSTILLILAFLAGVANGAIYMLIWSLLADVVDFQHYHSKIRNEAIVFAFSIMIMKVGLGVGSVILGWILDVIGYNPGEKISEQVTSNMALFICLITAVGSLLCYMILSKYRIDRKMQKKMARAIKTYR
ncbi:glycoside-pentoside-hexuronide (GPH):cation symporter [Porticoccus sp. W117]|uniref:MFS transporter n=1 Tax=Porticoccus sp. W117 TaxID=3054777 RepID=UPI0025964C30|nr:glycoside-pentoside-hexuronide (GPH):cation symporter [Porticoccus sp. W117]MDM3872213.1 glycoside-pentoside-hexuronide (GPH):cation symporter [Porticoccus sp. W117]